MNDILIIDAAMTLLLLIAITFCWKLNRKINSFKKISKELTHLVHTLSDCVSQISHNTEEYQLKVNDNNLRIGPKEELELLIEQSENLATRLDRAFIRAQQAEQTLKSTIQVAHTKPNTSDNESKPILSIYNDSDFLVGKQDFELRATPNKKRTKSHQKFSIDHTVLSSIKELR